MKGGTETPINSGEIREGLHENYVKVRGWPRPYTIESWSGVKLSPRRQMFGTTWTPTGFDLYLARAYAGKVEGLCGNMNRNFGDDFTLQSGDVLSLGDSRFVFISQPLIFSYHKTIKMSLRSYCLSVERKFGSSDLRKSINLTEN